MLDAYEEMVGCSTSAAEQELSKWVSKALKRREERSRPDESQRRDPTGRVAKTRTPEVAAQSTASVMYQQEELVHGIVKRATTDAELPTDVMNELIAEGHLGVRPQKRVS
ncbi:MAG: hypothetical protein OER77_09325 [Myxococcales bacterium]|nr:hypothetical protein [Myxococcales bacterium]